MPSPAPLAETFERAAARSVPLSVRLPAIRMRRRSIAQRFDAIRWVGHAPGGCGQSGLACPSKY